jgi:hypothetical protein
MRAANNAATPKQTGATVLEVELSLESIAGGWRRFARTSREDRHQVRAAEGDG